MAKKNSLLALIVLLAAALRLSFLDQFPPSLNWDEVSHGYNAYSILKTGRDEWGQFFPLIFRAYGDFKLPLYIYLTTLSIKIFGLTPLAVRLVSALSGIGSVLFTFLLTKELFPFFQPKGKSGFPQPEKATSSPNSLPTTNYQLVPFLAALLLAVSPWSIFLSRIAVEANLASFLIIAATYFFLKSIPHPNATRTQAKPANQLSKYQLPNVYLVISSLLFGLSLFAYNSARIFTPLLILLLVFLHRKKPKKTLPQLSIPTFLFLIFFSITLYQMLAGPGRERFRWISLLDQGAINHIIEQQTTSQLPPPLPRLLHNKLTYATPRMITNYLSAFSPQFLFLKGGDHYQFSLPNHGLIYPIQALLVIAGLLTLTQAPKKSRYLILGWLLLAPIPTTPTRDNPHTLRLITMLPLPQILAAWGAVFFYKLISKQTISQIRNRLPSHLPKLIPLIYFTILFLNLKFYLLQLATSYPKEYSWAWQYGYKQAVTYAKNHYSQYDRIVFTKKYGEPHEFILFHWPWNPTKYHQDPKKVWDYHARWYWIDAFDKFLFINDWEIKEKLTPSTNKETTLLITSPNNAPPSASLLETISFLDESPAFEIYSL